MNKKFKLFLAIFLAIFTITLYGCGEDKKIMATGIAIEGEKTCVLGENLVLTAKALPEGAEFISKQIGWSSENEKIATVKDGVVTFLKLGKTKIYAGADGFICEYEVECNSVAATGLKIEGKRSGEVGDKFKLTAVIYPNDAAATKVSYVSNDPSVATVDGEGNVELLKIGSTTLTIKAGSITVEYKIVVAETESTRKAFDELLDQMFIDEFSSDPLNINFSLRYPEKFGLDDAKVEAITISAEEEAAAYEDVKETKAQIEGFAYDLLTESQQLTYDILIDKINTSLSYEGTYYLGLNLGSYLGYNAQIPIILAEYHFYTEKDIQDYFDYITTTKETYENIVAFEKERAEKGYGMADFILDGIISQCNEFVKTEITPCEEEHKDDDDNNVCDLCEANMGVAMCKTHNDENSDNRCDVCNAIIFEVRENYLLEVFNDKIDELDYLTDEKKAEYKKTNKTLVEVNFVDAFKYLASEMEKLKGKATNEYGLYYTEGGKEYYESLFRDATGSNMTVDEAFKYLKGKANKEVSLFMAIYNSNRNIYDDIDAMDFAEGKDVYEILEFFMEKYKEDFPELTFEVDVEITEIHKSLVDHTSPAMYFLSPIDANTKESIFINPKNFEDTNYAYTTMAHEGIPGHLLQHVTFKTNEDIPNIRKALNYTGYSEAWATYVEEYMLKYTNEDQDTLDAYNINNRINYLIYCVSDIGIHYYGWKEADIDSYVSSLGFSLNNGAARAILEQIIETPTNTLEYYCTYYLLQDLKTAFKAECNNQGVAYTDKLFHTFYLMEGCAPFYILEEQIPAYVAKNKQINK